MERRRQELMADEGSHWRQRAEAERLIALQAAAAAAAVSAPPHLRERAHPASCCALCHSSPTAALCWPSPPAGTAAGLGVSPPTPPHHHKRARMHPTSTHQRPSLPWPQQTELSDSANEAEAEERGGGFTPSGGAAGGDSGELKRRPPQQQQRGEREREPREGGSFAGPRARRAPGAEGEEAAGGYPRQRERNPTPNGYALPHHGPAHPGANGFAPGSERGPRGERERLLRPVRGERELRGGRPERERGAEGDRRAANPPAGRVLRPLPTQQQREQQGTARPAVLEAPRPPALAAAQHSAGRQAGRPPSPPVAAAAPGPADFPPLGSPASAPVQQQGLRAGSPPPALEAAAPAVAPQAAAAAGAAEAAAVPRPAADAAEPLASAPQAAVASEEAAAVPAAPVPVGAPAAAAAVAAAAEPRGLSPPAAVPPAAAGLPPVPLPAMGLPLQPGMPPVVPLPGAHVMLPPGAVPPMGPLPPRHAPPSAAEQPPHKAAGREARRGAAEGRAPEQQLQQQPLLPPQAGGPPMPPPPPGVVPVLPPPPFVAPFPPMGPRGPMPPGGPPPMPVVFFPAPPMPPGAGPPQARRQGLPSLSKPGALLVVWSLHRAPCSWHLASLLCGHTAPPLNVARALPAAPPADTHAAAAWAWRPARARRPAGAVCARAGRNVPPCAGAGAAWDAHGHGHAGWVPLPLPSCPHHLCMAASVSAACCDCTHPPAPAVGLPHLSPASQVPWCGCCTLCPRAATQRQYLLALLLQAPVCPSCARMAAARSAAAAPRCE